MKFKKAISPLIATILLVVVAVILVSVVLTWGKSFASDSLAKADDVDTSCVGVSINASDCVIENQNKIKFVLRNTSSKSVDLDGFQVLIEQQGGQIYGELPLSSELTLSRGEMDVAIVETNTADKITASSATIRVRSGVCSVDATSTAVCRKI